MQNFILSTSAWLEALAKKEVEKVWWQNIKVEDRLVSFEWDYKTAWKVNIWSRVWNRLFLNLWEKENVENFDDLFSLVNKINFLKLVPKKSPIIVNATSIRSWLTSTPTIQKISKKAIIDNLWWGFVIEDENFPKFEILVLLINDKARILLDLSWEALHKRGYRKEAWEAPIKETLAAGLVLLSNWRFSEKFYDIFCGSWTIPIEAAMIARNIAPWLKRNFSIVDLGLLSKDEMRLLKEEARLKQFNSKYKIFASDIDEDILEIAKNNALDAWVYDTISFEKKDFREFLQNPITISWTLVSNPPYWIRLKDEDLVENYKKINKLFLQNKNLNWWIISSYLDFDKLIDYKNYKKRKVYNWGEMCYFWKKI